MSVFKIVLTSLVGYLNPPTIEVRQLGRGQVANINACKKEALEVLRVSSFLYRHCVDGLYKAQREIEQPVMMLNTTQITKIKVDIVADDN